jgi:hypothetical protein
MDKIVRLTAEQTGTITSTQNLLDFHISNDGGVIDLSKSYLSLKVRQTTSDTDANITNAVFNHAMTFNVKDNQTDKYIDPVGIIKHASLESQNMGGIESLRDVNVLRLNQKNYFESEEQKLKSQINNVIGVQSNNTWGYISPLIQASAQDMSSNTGGVASQNIDAEHRVHLKDIWDYCRNDAHSTSKHGQTRMHLEIDFDRLGLDNTAFVSDAFLAANEAYGSIDDAADSADVVLTRVYDINYKQAIPYYVGMPIESAAGTIGGAAHGSIKRRITNITYNETSGKVTLTLNAAVGGATVGLVIKPAEASTKSFTMLNPQLVLYYRGDSPTIEPFQYFTYSSEKDFLGDITPSRTQYEVEADSVGLIIVPKDNAQSLFADKNLLSYRLAVDNKDLTNRSVFKNSSLYFDRLNRYGMNTNKKIEDILGQKLQRAHRDDMRTRGGTIADVFCIFEPLPVSDKIKLVEIELVANAGNMSHVQIFKEMIKSV